MALKNFKVNKGIDIREISAGSTISILPTVGDPEGVLAANIGSIALDTTSGNVYKKISGIGNTGWEELSGSSAIAAFDWKANVRAVATTPITLSGTQTIDGVSLVAGDRVLVMAQAAGATNGIYVVASGAWTRSTDADASAEVTAGMATISSEGTTFKGSMWALTTPDPITLGTTALVFTQINPSYTAGNGITITGHQIAAKLSTTGGLSFNGSSEIIVNPDTLTNSTYINSGNSISVNGYAKKQTTLGGSATVIDSIPTANVASVEWLVVLRNGSNGSASFTVNAVTDGTNVDYSKISILAVGTIDEPGANDVTVEVNGANLELGVTATSGYIANVTRIANMI